MILKILLGVVALILTCLTFFHWKQFSTIHSAYNLVEVHEPFQSRDAYLPYFRDSTPILFKNHSLQQAEYLLLSPLTIQKSTIQQATLHDFFRHSADRLLMTAVGGDTIVELSVPSTKYKRVKPSQNPYRAIEKLAQSPTKSIKIKLSENHFLSVPRFWLFRASQPVHIIVGHTPFSKFFHAFV